MPPGSLMLCPHRGRPNPARVHRAADPTRTRRAPFIDLTDHAPERTGPCPSSASTTRRTSWKSKATKDTSANSPITPSGSRPTPQTPTSRSCSKDSPTTVASAPTGESYSRASSSTPATTARRSSRPARPTTWDPGIFRTCMPAPKSSSSARPRNYTRHSPSSRGTWPRADSSRDDLASREHDGMQRARTHPGTVQHKGERYVRHGEAHARRPNDGIRSRGARFGTTRSAQGERPADALMTRTFVEVSGLEPRLLRCERDQARPRDRHRSGGAVQDGPRRPLTPHVPRGRPRVG